MSTGSTIVEILASLISINLPKMEKEICLGNILITIGVNQNGSDRQI
jgi:hypothetical protein